MLNHHIGRGGTAACWKDVWKCWADNCFLHLSLLNPSNPHLMSKSGGVWHLESQLSLHFPSSSGASISKAPPEFLQEVFGPQAAKGLRAETDCEDLTCLLATQLILFFLEVQGYIERSIFSYRDETGCAGQNETCCSQLMVLGL